MYLKAIHLWLEMEFHSVGILVYLLAQLNFYMKPLLVVLPSVMRLLSSTTQVASVPLLINTSIPTTCRMTILSTALN